MNETQITGRIPTCFNSTFIALIPKVDNPLSLNDFRPISLCNCTYKVVSKVIAGRFKRVLLEHISKEQFGFLEGRLIHKAIGVAQEGIHSMKVKNIKGAIFKIDLAKAFEKVSWLYIRFLLTHMAFDIVFIRWIMSCITTVSFLVLINGAASPLFHAEHGIRQGFPLSPLLFLLVAEGLSHVLKEAIRLGNFIGLQLAQNLNISHFIFVDDILILCSGSVRDL